MSVIVNSSEQMLGLSNTRLTENSPNFAAKGGNNLPVEKNSSDTVQISEAAKSKRLQNNIELVDVRGENGMYNLGLMALGESTIQEWSAKGINVSDEAVIAAGKAFQEAFKKNVEENGSSTAGSRLALNKHQILINSQKVPDWFTQEYENTLSSMDNKEMKSAFEKGSLFFTSNPSSSRTDALASYTSVEKNI